MPRHSRFGARVPRAPRVPRGTGSRRADGAASVRRRLDHLHLRAPRDCPKAWPCRTARPRLRRRRVPAVPPGRPDRGRRPRDGRAVGRLRRLVRGDVAGLALTARAWSRRRGPWCAAAWTSARGSSANGITVVSTVPTLVALWPTEALAAVRLLILGGEACPPEIGARLADAEREVWNTYGPTEATVVACAARLDRRGAGADRAAARRLGPRGRRRRRARRWPPGETGELIIGGVGLARYLDPDKDAEKYAPMPDPRAGTAPTAAATWSLRPGGAASSRAGPTTRSSSAVDGSSWARSTARCSPCPASPAPRPPCARTAAGNPLLVGYVAIDADASTSSGASPSCAQRLPAALVPRLAEVDVAARPARRARSTATRLPWPLPRRWASSRAAGRAGRHGAVARRAVARGPRRRRRRPGGRLLRARRRQPRRRAAGVPAARAVP